MNQYLRIAALTTVMVGGVVASAMAAQAIDRPAQAAAPAALPSLTASIRSAVARARPDAAADPEQMGVVATVADVIVNANVSPVQALASVRLAIAEERCVFEDEAWNRWGCAGLASVASSIEAAIGSGPAATTGEGGIAIATPPQVIGAGADYRSPVGN